MLLNARCSKQFRAQTMIYACYLIKRLPTIANGRKTPMEMQNGTQATDYDSLHIFVCPTYYHAPKSVLDPRAKKAKSLGFNSSAKGYRLW